MKTDVHVETFREYIARRLRGQKKAPKGVEGWDTQQRGENQYRGRNQMKRDTRAAHKLDRLAQIRAFREGSDAHVPKLKRIPSSVFE